MMDNPADIRFTALQNALYHSARRRFLETADRTVNFVIIILGTAAAADILAGRGIPASYVALATAAAGALQLVFGFGQRARTHELLQQRYYDLLAEVVEARDPDQELICRWAGTLARISGEEPPAMLLDQARAYNAAASALGSPKGSQLVVPWYVRLFGRLHAFGGMHLKRESEVAPRK